MIELTLPFPPSLNAMYRTGLKNACAKCRDPRTGARPFLYPSTEYQSYQGSIQSALERLAGGAAWPRIIQPRLVAVTANVYRPRRAGDLDNYFKALLDALSGQLYDDDSQIVELHAYRHEDKDRPRVQLVVSDVTPPAPKPPQGSLL